MSSSITSNDLTDAAQGLKKHFQRAFIFSLATNLLVLVPTGYMLEVYDRVVNSRSHATLAMLTLLAALAYILLEVLEWVRGELLRAAGTKFDRSLNARVFDAIFRAHLAGAPGSSKGYSDLRILRDFFSSPAAIAILDTPIAALTLILIYWIHPMLGHAALIGTLAQALVTYWTELKTHRTLTEANQLAALAQFQADNGFRNAEVIAAMGMLDDVRHSWEENQEKLLRAQATASEFAGRNTAVSKFLQLTQSSLLLGLGAWLTINQELGNGGSLMIVASVLGGRATAPLATLITHWKTVVNARDAQNRLQQLLIKIPALPPSMPLPAPRGLLSVESVTATTPGGTLPVVRNMSFTVPQGATLAIIGPSASGKSSLARLLVGIWPTSSGKVRLDGADVFTWKKSELGPHVGYLPQDVELFSGTIADNVARFGTPDPDLLDDAINQVGLGEFIGQLTDACDTQIGDDGQFLSGGIRQRIALARAIYGNPRLVILDEPNSSLDDAGEKHLLSTLEELKRRKTTTVIVTHRPNIMPVVDLVLIVREGAAHAFGPRDEVLALLSRPQGAANPPRQTGNAPH